MTDNKTYKINSSHIFKIGVVLSFLLYSTACNEFLDEVPDNRVDLDDQEKAAQLLTNAYSESAYAFTDWMTDDAGFITNTTKLPHHTELYEWEESTAGPTDQDSPVHFWYATYEAIAHANEVLNVLDELPTETEEEIRRKDALESEALLTRAYGHFMLVNLFAKHYDESTAFNDLGVPYVTTPETEFLKQYTRNTVQEVYDKVEQDMLRGIELVDDSFFANSGKYHFNRNAALAFASRFYLFKKDYEKCIEFSSRLLGNNPSSFVRDLTSDEFQAAKSSNAYPQLYSSPDLRSNLLLMRKISLVHVPNYAHGITDPIYSDIFDANVFFGTTDERRNPAYVKGENGLLPIRYDILFERSGLNSDVGIFYNVTPAFRGEEVLLNRAEAYIQENRVNDGLEDLQILVDRRYTGGNTSLSIEFLRQVFGVGNSPFISNRIVAMDFLRLERRKEFVIQGMRWFDVKRFEIEVEHDLLDGSTITLEENDNRKVLQIPSSAIEVGGLKPNPR